MYYHLIESPIRIGGGGLLLPGSVQQIDTIKLGGRGYPVHLCLQLFHLILDILTLHCTVGAVCRLHCQGIHPLQYLMHLVQGTFRRLHHGDTILGIG